MDWGAWSRDAVSLMKSRTLELFARHGVAMGDPYRWDLQTAALELGTVSFRLVTAGTVAGDSFLWSWANDAIPASAKAGIDRVREFGVANDLPLLAEPCAPGGLAQGTECLALAGRILDAHGAWIDPNDSGAILFLLHSANGS